MFFNDLGFVITFTLLLIFFFLLTLTIYEDFNYGTISFNFSSDDSKFVLGVLVVFAFIWFFMFQTRSVWIGQLNYNASISEEVYTICADSLLSPSECTAYRAWALQNYESLMTSCMNNTRGYYYSGKTKMSENDYSSLKRCLQDAQIAPLDWIKTQ